MYRPFGFGGDKGTCYWCGVKLRYQWDSAKNVGHYSSGYFCTLRCGFRFAVAIAQDGARLAPLSKGE